MQEDWYVVQTRPFQEEKVIFYLRQSGINIYLPYLTTGNLVKKGYVCY